MVVTSRRCGTLSTCSGSEVRSAAHMMGSAAFFAPEMGISPCSGTPPSMTSLSTRYAPAPPAHCSGVSVLIDSAWISSRMRLPSAP